MEEDLAKIQIAEKDILKQVIEICNEHKLIYYIVGGTLLGAVRHQGFIPWDDDIDISMPRPDYEKFLVIAAQELIYPYQLNTINSMHNGFCYYYARAENKTIMLERNATKMRKVVPVWIDVFPLDGVPLNDEEIVRWTKKAKIYAKVFNASQYSYLAADENHFHTKKKSFFNNLFYNCRFDRLINTKLAWKKLDKIIKRYNYDNCTRVTNFCGRYGNKEIVDKSVLGNGTTLEFDGLKVNAPEKYDLYLTQIYGDYMKLPPESERVHHNITII